MYWGLINSIGTGSANKYGICNRPGGSPDDDDNIYTNTVMFADQRDCGKGTDDDLEEEYLNVEEMHSQTTIDNDYEEDDIYQNVTLLWYMYSHS